MSHRRRHRDDDDDDELSCKKKPHASPDRQSAKRPTFPSYQDVSDLPTKIRLLCEIIAQTPTPSVDSELERTGLRITTEDVEEVLKLSYAFPGPATKFFRWAGAQINDKHTPYAWNLVVDLLGKNLLFDAMWDAAKSMRRERIISLATFASIFSSYVAADRLDDCFMAFEVMDQYGVPCDVTALNSLLSAICRLGKTYRAREFFARARKTLRPDADSYAILLEGWENESDPINALETFAEMVDVIGWDPLNLPAYDSFLSTIVRGPAGIGEVMKHLGIIRGKGCLPGMKFFRVAIGECLKHKDVRGATILWNIMAWKNGCHPDVALYNDMILLNCYINQIDDAYRFLDEMIMYGLFPDAETYNLMLKFLLKERKMNDAAVLFTEMLKNEHVPTLDNCKTAFRYFLDLGDIHMMMSMWKCMVSNKMDPLEESGNLLLLQLRNLDMWPEACKYAEDMADRGIKVHSSTLSKLRSKLVKMGKGSLYDRLLQKWKLH